MTTRFIPAISRGWLSEELYGWRAAPTIAACRVPYLYAKAMLVASGASTSAEREHVAGMLTAHFAGATDSDLLQFVNYYQTSGPSGDMGLATRLPATNARVVVYDALSTAAAGGSTGAKTTDAASQVARELGVPPETANRIASVCERETSLNERRRKLLLGDDQSPIA